MEIPFSYGTIVSGADYTSRKADETRLFNNFSAGVNTALISPRRWGKTSLVEHVLESLPKDEFIPIRFDAITSKTEEDFLANYVSSVNRVSGLGKGILEFLPSVNPRLVLRSGTADFELDFSLNFEKDALSVEEILDLPQKIAEKKKRRVIVAIDEFQIIGEYDGSLAFQRVLRSHWQRHQNVTYCLFGSKFNMMTGLFGSPRNPFYKFGDMFFLEKISSSEWISFLEKRFSETGKSITPDAANLVVELCENHSYYVQQLAQLSWFRTVELCTQDVVREAFNGLADQLDLQFTLTVGELTKTQTEFLRALCDGVVNFSSSHTLSTYSIGTSANVKNIRNALEKKEIISVFPSGVELQDPMLKYWLKERWF